MTTQRPVGSALVLAALACALTLAACGSSGKPGTPSASSLQSAGLAFADCMRAHGVPNFPDPTTSGGGMRIQITPGSGIKPFSPAFKAAQSACRHLLPGGGPGGGGRPSAQAKAQMLAISTCMRAHGVTDFPDPTTTEPPGPGAGYSQVLGHDGVFLAIPNTLDTRSPAFRSAAAACHFGR